MGMEPAAKRARRELVESSFALLSMWPQEDGKLWPPHRLDLTVIESEKKVVCNGSKPHGSWSRSPNELTIEFHYNGEGLVKPHIFLPIPGTDAWVQEKPGRPLDYRSILIPQSYGPLEPMID